MAVTVKVTFVPAITEGGCGCAVIREIIIRDVTVAVAGVPKVADVRVTVKFSADSRCGVVGIVTVKVLFVMSPSAQESVPLAAV